MLGSKNRIVSRWNLDIFLRLFLFQLMNELIYSVPLEDSLDYVVGASEQPAKPRVIVMVLNQILKEFKEVPSIVQYVELLLLRPTIHIDMQTFCSELIKSEKLYLRDRQNVGEDIFDENSPDIKELLRALQTGEIDPSKIFASPEPTAPEDGLMRLVSQRDGNPMRDAFKHIEKSLFEDDLSTQSINGQNWQLLGQSAAFGTWPTNPFADEETPLAGNEDFDRGMEEFQVVADRQTVRRSVTSGHASKGRSYLDQQSPLKLSSTRSRAYNIFDDDFLVLEDEHACGDQPKTVRSFVFKENHGLKSEGYMALPQHLKKALVQATNRFASSFPSCQKNKALQTFFEDLQSNNSNLPINRLESCFDELRASDAASQGPFKRNSYYFALVQILVLKNEDQKVVNLHLLQTLMNLAVGSPCIRESLLQTPLSLLVKKSEKRFDCLVDMMLFETLKVAAADQSFNRVKSMPLKQKLFTYRAIDAMIQFKRSQQLDVCAELRRLIKEYFIENTIKTLEELNDHYYLRVLSGFLDTEDLEK